MIFMLFVGWEVYIVKNCDWVYENVVVDGIFFKIDVCFMDLFLVGK